jgi:hypothetical protein
VQVILDDSLVFLRGAWGTYEDLQAGSLTDNRQGDHGKGFLWGSAIYYGQKPSVSVDLVGNIVGNKKKGLSRNDLTP